jgi:hypothetical protein
MVVIDSRSRISARSSEVSARMPTAVMSTSSTQRAMTAACE